jgi:hypothetical protein
LLRPLTAFWACPTLYLAAAFCLVSPAASLTIYRIGGSDVPPPQLDTPYEFIQLAWDDLDPALHSRSELVSLQPDFIAPKDLDPSTNLTPLLEELGGRILVLEWNGWQTWRDDDIWVFDDDPETAYLGDGHYLRVAGYGPQNKYWIFDFGGRFFLDRIKFYPRPRFSDTRFIERFLIGTSDGDPLKKGSRDYVIGWRGSEFDFDIVHDISENTEPNIELVLPPKPIQQLFIELPENTRGVWEISEFEIYAAGPAAQASYTSNIIDLGAPASLGDLTWVGRQEEGAKVELSVRAGDDDDPSTYWRRTFRGDELTRFGKDGRRLILKTYNSLERGAQAGIGPDTENWNFWTPPLDFDAAKAALPGDRLHRYVQLRADFRSTSQAGGRLDYVQFSASVPPVVSSVTGEINPGRVEARTPTLFTYRLLPHLEENDLGFDHLAIDTPEQVMGIEALRIGGVPVEVDITRQDAQGFEIALPRIDRQRTGELIEVDFRAEVFAFSTVFSGRVRDSTRPFEIAQPITSGSAGPFSEAAGLQVELKDIGQKIIGGIDIGSGVFTPNGDGANDALTIEYDLLYLVDAIDIHLSVYDLSGRQVATVHRGQSSSGHFTLSWDGTGPQGNLLPPGLYILRLTVQTDRGKEHMQRSISLVY